MYNRIGNTKQKRICQYGLIEITEDVVTRIPDRYKKMGNGFIVVDYVDNCFLAKTKSFKDNEIKWPPALKILEHTTFFYLVYGKLVIGYTNELSCDHEPLKIKGYKKWRERSKKPRNDFWNALGKKLIIGNTKEGDTRPY